MFLTYELKLVLIHYSLFDTVEEKDLCANKKCGDVCDTSHGMLMVMRYCQPDGACAMNSAPQCKTGIIWDFLRKLIIIHI